HALGERQAEAGSLVFAPERAVDLTERLARDPDLVLGHADAAVADADPQEPAFSDRGEHLDLAAGRRKFDGIGQQVHQYLLQHALVGPNDADLLADILRKAHVPFDRALTQEANAPFDAVPRMDLVEVEHHLS